VGLKPGNPKYDYLHFSASIGQSESSKGNVVVLRLTCRRGRGVECSHLAAESGHHLLEAPVVSDAEGVDQAFVAHYVRIKIILDSINSRTLLFTFIANKILNFWFIMASYFINFNVL